jgi:hypothetical protein
MISSQTRKFAFAAAAITLAVPVLSTSAQAQTYKIVNAANKSQSFVAECATRPKLSLKWIKENCTRVPTAAKGGNVEFEWKIEEGES